MTNMSESQSAGATPLQVSNKDNIQDTVKAFVQDIRDLDLLVAYGAAFDEGALVRDISSAGLVIDKALRKKGVFNLYPVCARIKKAHDRMFNPGYKGSSAATDATQEGKPFDLDAMHAFFIKSTGLNFGSPRPEGMLLF